MMEPPPAVGLLSTSHSSAPPGQYYWDKWSPGSWALTEAHLSKFFCSSLSQSTRFPNTHHTSGPAVAEICLGTEGVEENYIF